ncbi:phospholipase A2 AP-PLA2-I-like [Ptychodera flava]|uniref:phospholipase A2 AP-PLA2-I-like n=1 Tax=Ptychodera flava TaxID=63121 RepID=UPI00396A9B8C
MIHSGTCDNIVSWWLRILFMFAVWDEHLLVVLAEVLAGKIERQDRDLLELSDLIQCALALNGIAVPLQYVGYGCYCGPGGEGVPVDPSDECCRRHDQCYERSKAKRSCLAIETYLSEYDYTTKNCFGWDVQITCKRAAHYSFISVVLGFADCKEKVCECDKALALCLARNRATFNKGFEDWDRSKC